MPSQSEYCRRYAAIIVVRVRIKLVQHGSTYAFPVWQRFGAYIQIQPHLRGERRGADSADEQENEEPPRLSEPTAAASHKGVKKSSERRGNKIRKNRFGSMLRPILTGRRGGPAVAFVLAIAVLAMVPAISSKQVIS